MRSFLGGGAWRWGPGRGGGARTCCSSSATLTFTSPPTSWPPVVSTQSLVREEGVWFQAEGLHCSLWCNVYTTGLFSSLDLHLIKSHGHTEMFSVWFITVKQSQSMHGLLSLCRHDLLRWMLNYNKTQRRLFPVTIYKPSHSIPDTSCCFIISWWRFSVTPAASYTASAALTLLLDSPCELRSSVCDSVFCSACFIFTGFEGRFVMPPQPFGSS